MRRLLRLARPFHARVRRLSSAKDATRSPPRHSRDQRPTSISAGLSQLACVPRRPRPALPRRGHRERRPPARDPAPAAPGRSRGPAVVARQKPRNYSMKVLPTAPGSAGRLAGPAVHEESGKGRRTSEGPELQLRALGRIEQPHRSSGTQIALPPPAGRCDARPRCPRRGRCGGGGPRREDRWCAASRGTAGARSVQCTDGGRGTNAYGRASSHCQLFPLFFVRITT